MCLDRAQTGNSRAAALADGTAGWLGQGLGLLTPALQPEVVILGGHLARIADVGRAAMHAGMTNACPGSLIGDTGIVASELGHDAALVGAAEVAFNRLLEDPAGHGQRPGPGGGSSRRRRP